MKPNGDTTRAELRSQIRVLKRELRQAGVRERDAMRRAFEAAQELRGHTALGYLKAIGPRWNSFDDWAKSQDLPETPPDQS